VRLNALRRQSSLPLILFCISGCDASPSVELGPLDAPPSPKLLRAFRLGRPPANSGRPRFSFSACFSLLLARSLSLSPPPSPLVVSRSVQLWVSGLAACVFDASLVFLTFFSLFSQPCRRYSTVPVLSPRQLSRRTIVAHPVVGREPLFGPRSPISPFFRSSFLRSSANRVFRCARSPSVISPCAPGSCFLFDVARHPCLSPSRSARVPVHKRFCAGLRAADYWTFPIFFFSVGICGIPRISPLIAGLREPLILLAFIAKFFPVRLSDPLFPALHTRCASPVLFVGEKHSFSAKLSFEECVHAVVVPLSSDPSPPKPIYGYPRCQALA